MISISLWLRRSLAAALILLPTLVFAAPDVIYTNGKVITVNDQFAVASAFAVKGDRFMAVGKSRDIRKLADKNTRIVDLKGRTVVPGMIDTHTHFVRDTQYWAKALHLDGVKTRTEAIAKIKAHVADLQEDEWLLMLGSWQEDQFADDPRGFSREELDELSGDRPAFLLKPYSHAYVNTAFLERFQIPLVDKNAPQAASGPMDIAKLLTAARGAPGGKAPFGTFLKRDEHGEATSFLGGGMMMVMMTSRALPRLSHEQRVAGVSVAQQYYNSLGLTSVYDPGGGLISNEAYAAVETLHNNNELTLRTFRTHWIQPRNPQGAAQVIASLDQLPAMLSGDDFYDTLAIGEALYPPMNGHDSLSRKNVHIPDEHRLQIRLLMEAILKRGIAAQIHAVTTEALQMYVGIAEELSQSHTLYPRQITFTHAEGVTPELLQRMQALGIALQLRSNHAIRMRDKLIEQYGEGVLHMPPLRMIQDSGVAWGFSTDGPRIAQVNPMVTLGWAVTGKSHNGEQVLEPAHLVTREEALIAHTRGGAYMVFRENSLGQIRPGFYADFVVLDRDYLKVKAEEIANLRSVQTVVGGKTVFTAGAN